MPSVDELAGEFIGPISREARPGREMLVHVKDVHVSNAVQQTKREQRQMPGPPRDGVSESTLSTG